MDSLGLIYIRKAFTLFIYVTLERKYCDVKSEREIFDLRNVVIIIIVIVAWPSAISSPGTTAIFPLHYAHRVALGYRVQSCH